MNLALQYCNGSAQLSFLQPFKFFLIADSEAKDKIGEPRKGGLSRASSKAQSRDCSRPPSAIENHIDYFKEPVVKVRKFFIHNQKKINKFYFL